MNIDDQLRMQKAMDALNSKLTLVLPDLMSSNTKLGERLKNKLKVSTLFNNIEHRNRKYLKAFIYNANQRANFLKTGLELNKAIKQSKKNMSSLCKQMEGDLILKNMDILLNEKKLISENTEQETHMKLNNLINTMKRAIKPPLFTKRDEEKKELKILTENEIDKIKDYISDKIIKEKNNLVNNINIYVNELNNSFGNGKYEKGKNKNQIKKEFHRFVDNLNFVKDIKLINFKKPKPIPIKDKESANLLRIKKLLYPTKSIRKEVIEPIKTKEKEYNVALIFMSDHGESLGENNIFLHSAPYDTAPIDQKNPAFFMCFSQDFADEFNLDLDCLKQHKDAYFSQDNIFHSMLGLFDISSKFYQKDLDIFNLCKKNILPQK